MAPPSRPSVIIIRTRAVDLSIGQQLFPFIITNTMPFREPCPTLRALDADGMHMSCSCIVPGKTVGLAPNAPKKVVFTSKRLNTTSHKGPS